MFIQGGAGMRKLLMVLLSLIFITSAVPAIVITEIDNDSETMPITINSGENISISLIREELLKIKKSLLDEIDISISKKTDIFEEKIDDYFLVIISKIGLGFICLALFGLNLTLAKKLLLEMVFEDA